MKKTNNKLINKKVFKRIVKQSALCQHAIHELNLAGYNKNVDDINALIYQQILEIIAAFSSHNNSNDLAPFKINLINKLCNWDIISPLRFTDDEWVKISADGVYQNKRKINIFKNADGSIYYTEAFVKRPIKSYDAHTKKWTDIENPICYHGSLFEHEDNVLNGRYFSVCNLWSYDISKPYTPKETMIIDCIEVNLNDDNCFMAVSNPNADIAILNCNYNIQWRECECLKGVHIEDVTTELLNEAFKENV